MKTFKKLFSVSAIVALLGTLVPMYAFGATYTAELVQAYDYAHDHGITTMSSIDNADMYGNLTRIAMAKMLANYAIDVLGLTPDTTKECTFPDVTAALDAQYDNGVTKACQLGLMGVGIEKFNPNGTVTRAEFGTAFSRALNANDADKVAEMNKADPYYKEHLNFLKEQGIMNDISNPNMLEVRGYVMLMMMRSDSSYTPTEGCSAEELLKCLTADDYDACVAACSDENTEEEQDPEEVKAGTLNVTMTSEEGGEFPSLVSSLPVVTYTLKAADEDINVNAIVIEEGGYAKANTLEAALYIDGQRVSKTKPLVALDKEYTLNLTNAYTIKAGKSVDIEVRVSDVNTAAPYAQQFNIKLASVSSSAEKVNLPSNVKSNTFKLLEQNTAPLTVAATTALDNPKAGTKDADLFEIRLDNTAGTQDVEFNSITLLGQSAASNPKDLAEDLENVKLLVDNNVVAKGKLNGKYLTFVLDTPYAIEKGKKATFTVRADVVGGAGKTFNYALEEAVDLSATAVAYNAPVRVTATPAFTNFTISAGRVVIERTNPSSNVFTKNRTNVFLGSFVITDNNKSNLTLNKFDIVFNAAVNTYIDSVKVRYGSNTAGLVEGKMDTDKKTFHFEDEQNIGSKLTVYVYADIQNVPVNGLSFTAQADNFNITEDENDTLVTDISKPNSWMLMNGADSALNITNVKLSNEDFAKGAEKVEAISFKVKTNSTEGVKMKRLEFVATCNTPASCTVNSNTIRNAKLYVGDKEYTATVNNGTIKLADTIELAKDTTTVFTLKVDLASNPDATNFSYQLNTYEAEDTSADRNDLSPTTTPIAGIVGRTINVKTNGELTISLKNTINNNKKDKSVLAGTEAEVAEYTLKTTHEDLKVVNGKITLAMNGLTAANLDRLDDVQLVYGGELVASDATITAGNVVFDNVNFDIKSDETPLVVKVITKKFTSDTDVVLEGCSIASITFTNVYGKTSGSTITTTLTNNTQSKVFDVVPATVTVTKKDTSTNAKTELTLTVDKGNNKRSSSNEIKTYVNDLAFNVYATDGDIKQVIVRKGTDTLAVVKYSAAGDGSDVTTTSTKVKIGSTKYYRCDMNTNLSVWELEEGDNDITLIYQVKDSDVSYTADLVAAKIVYDIDGTITAGNLLTTAGINNRMDILPLVSK